jgi:putative ABC transport system permease protein
VLDSRFVTEPYPPVDIWLPLQADPDSISQNNFLLVAARLKDGVTIVEAQAAMKLAAAEFRRKFSAPGIMDSQESFTAIPMRDVLIENVRPALLMLLGTVGFVLLIACANMANLLLARGALRSREIAVRVGLGASRQRVIFQLLTESVLLSIVGGILGLILGYFGVRGLLAISPGNVPRIGEYGAGITVDTRVLVFTLLISVLTGILFGIIPAYSAARPNLTSILNESGSRSGTSLRQNKGRAALIITEVALAVVLLVGAGLLIRTFAALRSVNPGFDPRNVLTMQVSLDEPRFGQTSGVAQLVRDSEQRISGMPGVEGGALTVSLPLGIGFGLPFRINANPPTDGQYNGDVIWHDVSPGYFKALRIPILRGRPFTNQDDGGAVRVVLISEVMAKQFWPQGDPIGDLITVGDLGTEYEDSPRQIIGVVADIKERLNWKPIPAVYVPIAQTRDGLMSLLNRSYPMTWVIRTEIAGSSLSTDIQRELEIASGGLPLGNIRSMDQLVFTSTERNKFNMTLLSLFAGVALLLAAIGVYGLTAYSVQQRTHEIGIRMALGAEPSDVLSVVLRDGLLPCLIGITVGIVGALMMSRLLKSMIFEVSPIDPLTFGSVAVLLASVAFVACWFPARRATRVDPVVALRHR